MFLKLWKQAIQFIPLYKRIGIKIPRCDAALRFQVD